MKNKFLLFTFWFFCSFRVFSQGICFNGNAIYYSTPVNHNFLGDITVGLFNGDNIPDLAIAWNTQLEIKMGTGNGSFINGGSVILTSPSNLKDIFGGDFDNDSYDDIATINGYNSLYVAWGNGTGTFTETGTPFLQGTSSQQTLTVDFNNDGLTDIIILDASSDDLIIYKNNGNRVFTDSIIPLPFSTGRFGTGDFNNDNFTDLIITSGVNIVYYLGDGAGNFIQGNTVGPFVFNVDEIAGGDLDHNGSDDLVYTDNLNVYFAFRDAAGNITNTTSLKISSQAGGMYADAIKVKDINQDNYPEVFISSGEANNIAVIKNNAGMLNTFSKYVDMQFSSRFCLYDIDLDGHDDIVTVAPSTSGYYSVIRGLPNSDFKGDVFTAANANSFFQAENLCAGDLNNDGFDDLVTAGSDSVNIVLNDGTGHFVHFAKIHVGPNLAGIAIADFSHDGNNDIIVDGGTTGSVYELTGLGNGTFNPATVIYTSQGAQLAEAADFNNDGYADLAVGSATGFYILLNNGSGTLVYSSTVPNYYHPSGFAIGDFNNDGYNDIAAMDYSGGGYINLNNQSGGFSNFQGFAICVNPTNGDIACADFNRDGNLDLALTNYGCPAGNKVYVYYGDGAGNAAIQTSYAVTGSPYYLTAADINLDSFPDIVVSTHDDLLNIAINNRSGGFAGYGYLAPGNGALTVINGDFNHDSKPDLACANYGSEDIMVALNSLIQVYPGPDADLCSGDSVLLYVNDMPGTFHWSPNTSLTSDSIYVTTPGNYYVVPDSIPFGQCITSTTVHVHLHTSPTVIFDYNNNPDSVCDTNPIVLNAYPAGGTFTGQNVNGNVFNPSGLSQGTYTLTYTFTDTNGCSASASIDIFVALCAGNLELEESKAVTVFPNPAKDELVIQQNAGMKLQQGILTNSIGEIVLSFKIDHAVETIRMKNLPNGVYQLKLSGANKTSVTKKIIVIK